MISMKRSGFLGVCRFFYATLVASEAVEDLMSKRRKGVIVKLDSDKLMAG